MPAGLGLLSFQLSNRSHIAAELRDADVAIIGEHLVPVGASGQLGVGRSIASGVAHPGDPIGVDQVVGPIDQVVDALQRVAISLHRGLGRSIRISEGTRAEEVGVMSGLATAVTGAGLGRQGVIHEHRAAQVGTQFQPLSGQAGIELGGGAGGLDQVELHQGVVHRRAHDHASQLLTGITKLGDAIHHQALAQSSASAADAVAGGQGTTGHKETLEHIDHGLLHVAHPVLTGATSDGLHRVRASQFTGQIRSLPGATTNIPHAGLHIASQGGSGQAGGVVQNLGVTREIAEERQINGFAPLGEFSLDGIVSHHQARGGQSIAILNLFLLILKEELGNKRDACEQHRSCLLRKVGFAVGCRKLGTAERDESGPWPAALSRPGLKGLRHCRAANTQKHCNEVRYQLHDSRPVEKAIKKPATWTGFDGKPDQRSGGGVQSPALAGGDSLFASRNSCVSSSTADVESLSAGHSRETVKKLNKIGASEGCGNHIDAATGHPGVIGNAKSSDNFFNGRSDLATNNVAIGFEGHDDGKSA